MYGADLYETSFKPYQYVKVSRLSPDLNDLFSFAHFDVCVNAAGSGNVSYSMSHPFADFEANSLDTIRILEIIRKVQPTCKYLHISSAAVYGNPEKLPICETDAAKPLSPYGWHKLLAEYLCREYSQIYGLKTAIIRPFSVYGPGLKKQLFWDLYQKTIVADDYIELWGLGTESRDFVYITDVIRCLELIANYGNMSGEVYNIASGTETTIREVATEFCKVIKPQIAVTFNSKIRQGDPLNWKADISKIESLGFKPQVDISLGISKIAEWFKSL